MCKLNSSKFFTKKLKKLIENKRLELEVLNKSLQFLAKDPFSPVLRTHKVNTRKLGKHYSSRIDGDLRIIWNFDQDENLLKGMVDFSGYLAGLLIQRMLYN